MNVVAATSMVVPLAMVSSPVAYTPLLAFRMANDAVPVDVTPVRAVKVPVMVELPVTATPPADTVTAPLNVEVPLTVSVARAAVPDDVIPVRLVRVPTMVELPVTAIPPASTVPPCADRHEPSPRTRNTVVDPEVWKNRNP